MIRDNIKSDDYWEKFLSNQESEYEEFSTLTDRILHERGVSDQSVKYGYTILHTNEEQTIYAMYSAGTDLGMIKSHFDNLVSLAEKADELIYEVMIFLLPMAVLLGYRGDSAERICSLIQKTDSDDVLIQLFRGYLSCGGVELNTDNLIFPEIYAGLRAVIFEKTEKRVDMFSQYLKKEWYKRNEELWWHNTHKRDDIYVGYWAFECAAVAKVLGFAEDDVKGLPYFPLDLFNYSDGMQG
jgi:hypothetical protein